jgi:hypothetical protein
MMARVVLAWCFFVPGAWFAVIEHKGGITALMGALALYIGILALAFTYRFLSGRWKEIDLIGREPALTVD